MTASVHSLKRDERGVAAVEFALLLIPLLVGILGFLELGYQSYVRSQLQGVLNEVARAASVEDPVIGDPTTSVEDQIQQRVRARMAPLVHSGNYTFTINSYDSFSTVGKPEALITDKNGNGRYDAGDCWQDSNPNGVYDTDSGTSGTGNADDAVVYEVNLTVPRLSPIGNLIGSGSSFQVDAKTIVRRQPFADQPKPPVVC
jgi:Flp pilus assembly protein TadG